MADRDHGYPIHVLDATVAAMVAETRPAWLRGLIARHGEPLISRDKQAGFDVVDYSWIDQHMSVRIGWTSHETEDGPTRTYYVTAIRGARSEQLLDAEPFTEADISSVVALAGLDDAADGPAHECMYSRIYNDAQKALDELLGPDEEDGCDGGLVAHIWHLARRCEHYDAAPERAS